MFTKLEVLKISSFDNLRTLFSLDIFRDLINLRALTVSCCLMLESIVKVEENEDEGQRNRTSKIIIPKLKVLYLSELPKIRCFCSFSNALELPSLEVVNIKDCPMMETFALNFSCSSSMSNSSIPRFLIGKQVTCPNLLDLNLRQLGMEIISREVQISMFTKLEVLEISSFDNLRTLFSLDIFRDLINLRELTVSRCLMLEGIVKVEENEDEGQRNRTSKIIIPKLEKLYLSELPKIRYFCCFSNALELPSLEEVEIKDCLVMETFVLNLSCCSSTSNSSIPRFIFGKQATCPKLKWLTLQKLKVCGQLFSHEIPIASLGTLREVEVEFCDNLKSLFSARTFGGLTNLVCLEVKDCLMLEEVIAKEDVDDEGGREMKEVVVRLPELRRLRLENLPKLRGFSHMHGDLEFPSLEEISMLNCTEMKTAFSLGCGFVRMPKGVKVCGMGDPEFASKLFFKGEHRQDEDSLDNGCFMLLPSDLSLTQDSNEVPSVVKGSSDVFFPCGWRKVCGKFDMAKLSSGIVYEIVFVIMLVQKQFGIDESIPKLEIIIADDKRIQNIIDPPTDQWVEILAGELRPSSGQCGEITFSLENNPSRMDIVLKGVSIRVKEIVA